MDIDELNFSVQERTELDGLALRAARTIKEYCEVRRCEDCCLSEFDPELGDFYCGLKSRLPFDWEVDDD